MKKLSLILFRQRQIGFWLRIGVLFLVLGHSTLTAQITFTPNLSSGITTTVGAMGFAWGDYDGDGDIDVFIGGASSSSVLYSNNGDGTFTSVSYTPADPTAYTLGSIWADFDGDADLDLLMTQGSGLSLYLNDGRGVFTDNTAASGLNAVAQAGNALIASAADYDRDGDLDIVLAGAYADNTASPVRLFQNNGGYFTDVAATALDVSKKFECWNPAWVDYNNDGWMDLWMPTLRNGLRNNCGLFLNKGDGTFADSSASFGDTKSAIASAWSDYDSDGDMDLVIESFSGDGGVLKLFRNNGDATFDTVQSAAGLTYNGSARGLSWGDFDNDGYLDLLVGVSGGNLELWHNNGDGTFTNGGGSSGVTSITGGNRSALLVDYDNDGFLDIYLNGFNSAKTLLHNEKNSNHWVGIKLADSRNRSTIGARITLYADGKVQSRDIQAGGCGGMTSGNIWAHFGLGQVTVVDSVIVRWPEGSVKVETNLVADSYYTITIFMEPGDPVAYYNFDEGPADVTGNGYDGTFLGDAHVKDGFLFLDGVDDAVEIPRIGGAGATYSQLTYSMWVYPTVDLVPLQFSGGLNTHGWTPGAVHFKLNYGKVNVGINGLDPDLIGRTVVEPNRWSHIALTISEKEVALYLNGEVENSRMLATPLTNLIVGDGIIGAWTYPDLQREFTGLMEDVRIYDYGLSKAEVRYLAESIPVAPLIIVDGKKDPFYQTLTGPNDGYLQIKSYAFNDNGIPTGDADLSAKVWTAWDDDWFYLYEEVKDDTLAGNATNVWEEDCIELKFDPQPTDSVLNSVWDTRLTALGKGTAGVVSADSLNNVADSLKQWTRTKITGGYALELAIKWSAIKSGAETISPAVDNVFGMAICQHDNDGKARRQASIMWGAVMLDAVWNTPKYHGTVKFLADNKLQFIPKNNVTGRTNSIPYDETPFYIRIDGKKDPFYHSLTGPDHGYLQIRSYAYNDNGKPVNDADLSAKVWAAWDDQWFYLYEEVKDDTLAGNATNVWEEDCIELKFDPQATDSVRNSVWDTRLTALGKAAAGVVAADSLNNVADSLKQWTRTRITGGYALELAIKWPVIKSGTEVISVAVDSVFGMAICQHDNDGKARRQASVMWGAVMLDAVWNMPKYHGTVKFLADNKLQFIPKNNVTGRTNPIPYDGSDYTSVASEEAPMVPKMFSLEQNYPNPFNPTTTILYSIPSVSQVHLTVYDMLGREVMVLVDERKEPGNYSVIFDAKNYASGIYFYRLKAGSYVKSQKMLMLK